MTVSAAMIGYVSPYTVADGTAFPTALFTYYTPIAKAMLDTLAAGVALSTALYDHCHALLIAHLHTVKGGSSGYASYKSGDVQWTKSVTSTGKGTSPFMIEVMEILAQRAPTDAPANTTAADVTRADADLGQLKLDRGARPSFFGGV